MEIDPRAKRSRLVPVDGRTASLNSLGQLGNYKDGKRDGRSISAGQSHFVPGRSGLELPRFGTVGASPAPSMLTALSPNLSATSSNLSATSPNVSVTSPNDSAPLPHLSTISPSLSAVSPYLYSASAPPAPAQPPTSARTPPTWPSSQSNSQSGFQPSSQPNVTTSSQPSPPSTNPLSPTSSQSQSQPSKPKKHVPRQTPLQAQTDLPLWSGPFITPREQIGLPRVPVEVDPSSSEHTRGRTPGGGVKKKEKEKDKKERGVSEEEVRVMLAGGYYPSGGLEDGHRRLFGAVSGGSLGEEEGNPRAARQGGVLGDDGKLEKLGEAVPAPTAVPLPPPLPTSTSSCNAAGASKHYRSSQPIKSTPATASSSTSILPVPSRPSTSQQSRPPVKNQRRAPAIPKHSPVALPVVSRLPMMMTSPIRPTGARIPEPEVTRKRKGAKAKASQERPAPTKKDREFPPSLSEYSPLRRLLKNAGVDNLGEVLGQGGVLALKGAGGWSENGNGSRAGAKALMIREQEREVVDLTSDAEEDDAPVVPVVPVKAPALTGKPHGVERNPEPRTPPQRTVLLPATPPTPRRSHVQSDYAAAHRSRSIEKPSPHIRRANTSPERAAESPLFTATPNPNYYPEGPSSEGPGVPLDLPPSSPPPMSDSDLDPEAGSEKKQGYREPPVPYTDGGSSDAQLDLGLSLDGVEGLAKEGRGLDPYADFEDGEGDGWNETIRPFDSTRAESEGSISGNEGPILGSEALVFEEQPGLGGAEDVELDLASLGNLLDILSGETVTPDMISAELEAMLAQDADSTDHTGGTSFASQELAELDGAAAFDFSWLDALGSTVPGADFGDPGAHDADGEGDLAQILAALGTA